MFFRLDVGEGGEIRSFQQKQKETISRLEEEVESLREELAASRHSEAYLVKTVEVLERKLREEVKRKSYQEGILDTREL